MQPTFVFGLLISILPCIQLAFAVCSVSKYNEGFGDWIKCRNSTLQSAMQQGSAIVAAMAIYSSMIPRIPAEMFSKYRKSLLALDLHDCGIQGIDPNAFDGLTYLRKLSLANNNITEVHPQWFNSLVSLEQLDLSFNKITSVLGSDVAGKLTNLRRLNLNENRLSCLEPSDLEPLRSLAKIRFEGNPLKFVCRARMTLWLADHGVNYKSGVGGPETWLDRVLWLCATESESVKVAEGLMKECVLINLFNQLRAALITSESYPAASGECVAERKNLMDCAVTNTASKMNGELLVKILNAVIQGSPGY